MKKNRSITASTLIELIVSAMLVAIVALGITSINMVLNSNNQDYGQRYLVKSETQTTLNNILNSAALAIGSAGTDSNGNSSLGIEIGPGAPVKWGALPGGFQNDETVCIHQDILPSAALNSTAVNNPPTLPANYNADTRWLCYTWYPSTTASPYQIWYCAVPYASTGTSGDLRGATNCNFAVANGFSYLPAGTTAATFLGTSYGDFTSSNSAQFTYSPSPLLFSLSLQNCLNNSAASCNASGISTDPTDNPEVTVSGSVIPAQESD